MKKREVIRILMLSPIYFRLSLKDRLNVVEYYSLAMKEKLSLINFK